MFWLSLAMDRVWADWLNMKQMLTYLLGNWAVGFWFYIKTWKEFFPEGCFLFFIDFLIDFENVNNVFLLSVLE